MSPPHSREVYDSLGEVCATRALHETLTKISEVGCKHCYYTAARIRMGGRNSKPKQPKEAAEPVDPALDDGILADLDKQLAAIDAGEDVALPASLETPALVDIEKFGEEADGDVTIHEDEMAELEEELAGLDVEPETVAGAGDTAADAVGAVQSSVVDIKAVNTVTEAADMPEQEAAIVRPLAG